MSDFSQSLKVSPTTNMFEDTENKKAIRRIWDKPILQKLSASIGTKLSYFGMPGPQVWDLRDWSDLLLHKTGVQIVRPGQKQHEEDLETINKMLANVMSKRVDNFQLLKGAVEDVVLKGHDMDGKFPRLVERVSNDELRFCYDLINLDFEGGAGYKFTGKQRHSPNASGGQRIEAVRKVIHRQMGRPFVFFWTVNVRDTLGDEPQQYLREYARRIKDSSLQGIVDEVERSAGGMKHYLLKAWIPLFIKEEAELCRCMCHSYPPVVYEGHEKAKMVHFAFLLQPTTNRQLRVASKQDEERVIRLPMIEVKDGKFMFAEGQHISLTKASCRTELEFLGEPAVSALMSTFHSSKSAK